MGDESTPNVRTILDMYAAFRRGERAEAMRHVADDITLTRPGPAPLAGTYRGHEGFLNAQKVVHDLLGGGETSFEVQSMVGDRDCVFTLVANHLRRGDRRLDSEVCEVFRFRDGRIARIDILPLELEAWNQFWS